MTHSTITLPRIIFGTSSLGNLYRAISDDVKCAIVAEWFQQTSETVAVDSAGKYGAGLALESMAQSLVKLEVDPTAIMISNKLGWRRVPLETPKPTFEPGAWVGLKHDAVQDISYEGILRCWEQGSELLSPYKAELVSVHDPDEYLSAAADKSDYESRWNDILNAYQALVELREQGQVTAIGVGSKDWRVSQRLAEQVDLDWVMLATSLTVFTHSRAQIDFIESLRHRDVAVINSAVFHSGFLTGGDFFDYRRVSDSKDDLLLISRREQFWQLCERYEVHPAQACVSFGMSVPGVVATALNSSRPERVAENAMLGESAPPDEFWQEMKASKLIAPDFPYL